MNECLHLGRQYVGTGPRQYYYCVELDVDDPERPLILWYGVKHEDGSEEGKAGNYYSLAAGLEGHPLRHLRQAGCEWMIPIISDRDVPFADLVRQITDKYTSIHGERPKAYYSDAKRWSRSAD